MASQSWLLEAIGLRKVYPNGLVAVDGVTIRAGRGVVTVLMGPNGSGKTTTMSMIAGALRPTSGRVVACGLDVWGRDGVRARECIGFAPQEMPYREALRVIDNMVWYGMLRGMSPWEARRAARRSLEEVGLGGKERSRIGELSGGMKRRLVVATLLMWEPAIMILDEPTSGLDPAAREELWRLLSRLSRGRSVLVSTHIAEEAERHAGLVYVMHRGRVVASGSPAELIARHAPRARIVVRLASTGVGEPPAGVAGASLASSENGRLMYFSDTPDEDLPALISELSRLGFSVKSVEVEKPGLLEVYLRLAGGG